LSLHPDLEAATGGDREHPRADFWFHRNRQLDWKDQLAATERELGRLRLRGGEPSRADVGDRDRRATQAADWSELAAEIAVLHAEIARSLRDAGIDASRADRWLCVLQAADPPRAESVGLVDSLADEIRLFLNATSDWELGRRSLGSGMVVRDSLELTRSRLVSLSLTIDRHLRMR
jgi:hypothetical protein